MDVGKNGTCSYWSVICIRSGAKHQTQLQSLLRKSFNFVQNADVLRILGGRNLADHKLRLIALFAVFVMVCAVIPGTESPVAISSVEATDQNKPAAEVWSCDFDDGIPSDWEIYGIEGIIPYSNPPGSFSTDDGSLRSNSTGEFASMAHVNSSVPYGTWSFDVDVVDTYNHEIVIPFIIINWTLDAWTIDCYFFQIVTGMYHNDPQPRVQAGKMYEADNRRGKTAIWLDEFPYDDILGWKSFIITRENNGQFYFYMNGSLVLGFKDTQHTTCNQFAFGTGGGPAIDNIVVSDTVDYDAAPPEWDPEPTDQAIDLGQDFRYDLNATDFSGLGTWALNDTTNFAIDTSGVITNATAIAPDVYGLEVSVEDSLGNSRTAEFSVTVEAGEAPEAPLDPTMLIVTGGAIAVVVVIILVIFLKKRS